MPALDPLAVAVVIGAALLGAFVKGVTTLGLALIAVPLISLMLDIQTAILSLFLSKCLSDIAMLVNSRTGLQGGVSRRAWIFIAVGFAAIPLATHLLVTLKGPWLYLFLAVSILIFVAYQLLPRSDAPGAMPKGRYSWAFGFAAGVSQGLTGAAGPYAAMYLSGLRLSTREFVFLSSVIYVAFDISQLAAIAHARLYDEARIVYALLTIAPVMAGTYLGIRARGALDEGQFRKLLLVVLAASALALVPRALAM